MPQDCSAVLVPNITEYSNNEQFVYMYLSEVDAANYEEKKHDAAASGGLLGAFDFGADYNDFEVKRSQYLATEGVNLSDDKSLAIKTQTIPDEARKDWLQCMLQNYDVPGIQVWFSDHFATYAVVQLRFWAPAGEETKWVANVTGGTADQLKGTLKAMGTPDPYTIKRDPGQDIVINVHTPSGGGHAVSVFPSSLLPASLTVAPNQFPVPIAENGGKLTFKVKKAPFDGQPPNFLRTMGDWQTHFPGLNYGVEWVYPTDADCLIWTLNLTMGSGVGQYFFVITSAGADAIKGSL